MRPGVQIQVLDSAPPRSAPTDTGVWFVVGETEQGRTDMPTLIRSMDDYGRLLGDRVTFGFLYDALEVFFREGGSAAYVGRVVGPAAVKASHNLVDAVPTTSLVVTAIGPGDYGNSLKVQVVAGDVSGYQIHILDSDDNLLENSGDLADQASAVAWSAFSQYVRITLGAASDNPVVAAATALSGGDDDRASITDADWLDALNLFSKDLGPGNVSAPGRTTTTGYTQLTAHAAANNRVAFLDGPDTANAATVETAAANAKGGGDGQYAALFAPWLVVPGIVAGTQRTVPPSALAAGKCAQVDPVYGPGTPAAGVKGVSSFATDTSQPDWDDTTRDTLNTDGVDVIRVLNGAVTIYGWRSLADPINNPDWVPLGTVRYLMGLAARAFSVGQEFVFAPIDGQGHTISAYQGALVALCLADWNAGEIYGQTSSDAFNVDTGPAVNTPTVLAGNELRAVISVRPSPMAELVTIQIVNTPITQAVA